MITYESYSGIIHQPLILPIMDYFFESGRICILVGRLIILTQKITLSYCTYTQYISVVY